jgi:hypothetical protein
MSSSSFAFPLVRRIALFSMTVFALAACGGDDDNDPSGPGDDEIGDEWFESIDADGASSVSILPGSAPGESGGPDIAAALTGAFITGGTTQLLIGGEAFDALILALDGVDGYIEVEYDGDRSSADVALTLYGDIPDGEFELRIAGVNGDEVGDYTTIPVEVIGVGSTGPIQVSISWDTETDVDLHVVDPDGEEIYYGAPTSSTGGELDLDSNAGCGIDGVNNENITWSDDASPASGEYIVRVDYWDACDFSGTTNYIVTIRVDGEPTRTISGTLTGDGTHGGAGAGELVTTFDY